MVKDYLFKIHPVNPFDFDFSSIKSISAAEDAVPALTLNNPFSSIWRALIPLLFKAAMTALAFSSTEKLARKQATQSRNHLQLRSK